MRLIILIAAALISNNQKLNRVEFAAILFAVAYATALDIIDGMLVLEKYKNKGN